MKNLFIPGLAITVLFLSACQSANELPIEPVVTNHERLEASGEFLSLSNASLDSKDQELTLRHIVTVKPPSVDGDSLQSTDVHLVGNSAFISYNMAGEKQKGGVDVIDIAKITSPKMISSLELPNHDANAIYRHKDNVYTVGAVDSGGGAMLQIPFSKELKKDYSSYAIDSFAGTDVVVSKDKVFVTSGDQGGLEVFNLKSMALESKLGLKDARGVSASQGDDGIRVVLGQPGVVVLATREAEEKDAYKLGGNSIPESKSTVESGKTTSAVSLGEEGFKIICNENGQELAHVGTPGVTNAVSYDDGMIFAANGEDGVYVYFVVQGSRMPSSKCAPIKVAFAGSLKFEEGQSANHIVFRRGHLFVASGLGGFKIIEVSKNKSSTDFDDCDDDADKDDRGDDD